jgi:hypothetical protein
MYPFSFTMPNKPNIILDKYKKNVDFYFFRRILAGF